MGILLGSMTLVMIKKFVFLLLLKKGSSGPQGTCMLKTRPISDHTANSLHVDFDVMRCVHQYSSRNTLRTSLSTLPSMKTKTKSAIGSSGRHPPNMVLTLVERSKLNHVSSFVSLTSCCKAGLRPALSNNEPKSSNPKCPSAPAAAAQADPNQPHTA